MIIKLILIISVCTVFLCTLFYVFPIIFVCGDSMYPFLKDGDILVGFRFYKKHIKTGNIFVFNPPNNENYVIKRLTYKSTDGRLFFEGDNKDYSYDSRMYGYVDTDEIVALYLFTLHHSKKGANK